MIVIFRHLHNCCRIYLSSNIVVANCLFVVTLVFILAAHRVADTCILRFQRTRMYEICSQVLKSSVTTWDVRNIKVVQYRGVHPPKPMVHIPPISVFSPYFRTYFTVCEKISNILRVCEKFSHLKNSMFIHQISEWPFLVIHSNFLTFPPYFHKMFTFPPYFC